MPLDTPFRGIVLELSTDGGTSWEAFACAQTFEFTPTAEMIQRQACLPIAEVGCADFDQFDYGAKQWAASISGLYIISSGSSLTQEDLFDFIDNCTKVDIRWGSGTTGESYKQGTVLTSELTNTFSSTENNTWSGSWQGSGNITTGTYA